MTLASKVLLAVLLLGISSFAAWFIRNEISEPKNEHEVFDREIDLMRASRYDKAIRLLQTWVNDPRRDASHDGLIYHQLAIVNISKAWHATTAKDECIRQAELNLEKELVLYNKENPSSLRLDLLEIGAAHEMLGDLSDKDKCFHYGMARQELDRQSLLIQGDFYEADGRRFPLAPVRRDISKHLEPVNEKSSKAGCPSLASDQ